MHWYPVRRHLRTLACAVTLSLAAGCGGGHSPVDPNAGGGGGGGDNGIAGDYRMVNYGGRVSLPIALQIEGCAMATFTGGSLTIYDDDTWYLTIDYTDADGQQQLEDEGDLVQNGTTLSFSSADYGDSFQGSVEGTVVKFDYDFCPNGQTDMQPWFLKH